MPTPFDLNKTEFFSEWEKRNSSNSKFDFCVSSLNGASSELQDIIFGKIVNLEYSSLSAERKSACESLFQKNLSNTDPEIRAWIPLGIKRWGFNNLVDQVVELSRCEEDFMVRTCIFRALDDMSEEFVLPEEFQNQIVGYLLNPNYHNEESLRQRERAAEMLKFMGYRGVETYCKLVLDIDRWPYLISNWGISQSLLNDTWNWEKQSYEPGWLRREINSFSNEEKNSIEGFLIEMATIFEGMTHEDMDGDFYREKYDQGDEWDDVKEEWNRTYYRHENREGIYENGDGIVEIGLEGLGVIGTPSSHNFLVTFFHDESRNKLRTKYQVEVNPNGCNGCEINGYPRFRLKALKALGKNVPYSQIRAGINQLLDDSLGNKEMINPSSIRVRIAAFLSNYGRDPDNLFETLLQDENSFARTEIRGYLREMGEPVDIQSIVDDISLGPGGNRVMNLMQYLEFEENPDVDLIRQCITELASRDDLEAFKEFLEGYGEFEGMEIPFREVNQEVVDDWVQLLEGRILVTEEDPDIVILINHDNFQEENA
tara:strand:+ start:2269 stop:3891 length:1623 start_codon:yes stop_codon:yes gene_type:complete